MNISDRVRNFVADHSNLSLDQINDDLDVVKDIDWKKLHEDDHSLLFEEFIREFHIYVPQFDFNNDQQKNKFTWYEIPLEYFKFRFLRPSHSIASMTVGQIITVANAGFWDIASK